jgi:hypothetical protein
MPGNRSIALVRYASGSTPAIFALSIVVYIVAARSAHPCRDLLGPAMSRLARVLAQPRNGKRQTQTTMSGAREVHLATPVQMPTKAWSLTRWRWALGRSVGIRCRARSSTAESIQRTGSADGGPAVETTRSDRWRGERLALGLIRWDRLLDASRAVREESEFSRRVQHLDSPTCRIVTLLSDAQNRRMEDREMFNASDLTVTVTVSEFEGAHARRCPTLSCLTRALG